MSVPLPDRDTIILHPPSRDEIVQVCGAWVTALGGPDAVTDLQRLVLTAITKSMTGHDIDLLRGPVVDPVGLGKVLANRDAAFRSRIIQALLTAEMLLRPIPLEVTARVEAYARELGVEDDMFNVVRRLADGAFGLALVDFQRSGYEGAFDHDIQGTGLHTSKKLHTAWAEDPDDPVLAAQWAALERCAPGSLGRGLFEFYAARGFSYPGTPDSAPPLLAQHDWVHVLTGYGSTVESEIEVFTFIARANDDPRAFSLQAMVLSLFETGYLSAGAGLFLYDTGHLSDRAESMAVRMGDAMRRGALCACHGDLLSADWFSYADRSLEDVRRDLNIIPKSEAAWLAGSVTAWEHGGISPYQYEHGQAAAAAAGRRYDSYGATPAEAQSPPR